MKNRATLLLLLALVLCYGVSNAVSYHHRHEQEGKYEDEPWEPEERGRRSEPWEPEERGRRSEPWIPEERGGRSEPWIPEERGSGSEPRGKDLFLLKHSKSVVQTDAGEMRVVKGYGFGAQYSERPMHIGFITMEPKTLFVPQYLDSHLILFIRRGEAKIGLIYKDEPAERRLKTGDIYRVPAGSVFYLVNADEGQRLNIICSVDPEASLGWGVLKSFSIAGGANPILAGFDTSTLAAAYNVTTTEIRDMLARQQEGPIVYISDSHAPSLWKKFMELKEQDRLEQLKSMASSQEQEEPENEETEQSAPTWSWRKMLTSFFAPADSHVGKKEKGSWRTGKSPDSYNIYDRNHDFSNAYGWSIALQGSDYAPLKHSGIGVYLVNLTAGSMMAPHVNPTATEYGVVLRGSGTVQIVYPNGTAAMKAEVREGDIFWVPRYFPFCQIASRTGPFEFFGFTTSAHKNRPQFLAGRSSILQTLRSPELAAAFGVSEENMRRFIDAQSESVILPSRSASTPEKTVKEEEEEQVEKEREPTEKVEKQMFRNVIKNIGNMGFD